LFFLKCTKAAFFVTAIAAERCGGGKLREHR